MVNLQTHRYHFLREKGKNDMFILLWLLLRNTYLTELINRKNSLTFILFYSRVS